jgi:hypothetical protein
MTPFCFWLDEILGFNRHRAARWALIDAAMKRKQNRLRRAKA